MRRLLSVLAAVLLVVGVAGVANAAPLKWEGTLKVELGTLPTTFTTNTGVATVNASSGYGHLNKIRLADAFSTVSVVPVTDPDSNPPIVAVSVSVTDVGGTLSQISSSGGADGNIGTLPVRGVALICLFDPGCTGGLSLNLTTHTTMTDIIGVGIGGLLTVGQGGAIQVSIQANPWTHGQASSIDQTDDLDLVVVYSTGFAHGPASLTSSTALPSGVVKFVTPLQVTTNITTGSAAVLKLFSSIKLHFVPEPGMLLLLGSGVVGLVLLGRHRMKR